MITRGCLVVAMMSTLCLMAACQSASFNGVWRAEPRTDQNKPTFTLTAYPGGTYSLTTSSLVFQFRCDGKRYPLLNRLLGKESGDGICTSLTASTLDLSYFSRQQPSGGAQLRLADDGKSLSFVAKRIGNDGKEQERTFKYKRSSGNGTVFGHWVSSDEDPTGVLRVAVSGRAVTLEFPLAPQTAVLPVSGAEVHVLNDGTVSKDTQALQVEGKNKLRVLTRAGGVVTKQTTFTLSEDGNTITEYGWLQQHPEDTATYIYHRSR